MAVACRAAPINPRRNPSHRSRRPTPRERPSNGRAGPRERLNWAGASNPSVNGSKASSIVTRKPGDRLSHRRVALARLNTSSSSFGPSTQGSGRRHADRLSENSRIRTVGHNLNGADTMTAGSTPEPQLYSIRAAAIMLGVGRTTAWKLVYEGTLDSVRIGGRRMIRATSLHGLIANGTQSEN